MVETPNCAHWLNQSCHCISLDDGVLDAALREVTGEFGLEQLVASHPHLFSRSAVFVSRRELDRMEATIAAIERISALPAYRADALRKAHPHARIEQRARGAFLGFDFHLSDEGPKLIEINTNPGGGMLNALLRKAQRACCEPVASHFGLAAEGHDFVRMFVNEWRLARGDRPLRRIAIVDDDPTAQYLYPEFVLCRSLCEAHGIASVICDPRELALQGGELQHRGEAIDLVYNRLTDFTLAEPTHAPLLEALREDLAVITPHPLAHALYADKRRLVVLSDAAALRSLGASADDAELVSTHVPRTLEVRPELRESLWQQRKALFFKPESGYGSKAAYRGDKLTKRVFEELLAGRYVAQELVPPSSRNVQVSGEVVSLKVDIRSFVYEGQVQLVCARLYQGQTTNFRSVGGGFAPVYPVSAEPSCAPAQAPK